MELELRSQKIWGWETAVYLFLGGMGAGCYLVGVLFDLFSTGFAPIAKVGVSLGPPIVLIGTCFLLADLGRPIMAIRAIFRPYSSWISRGTLILTVFIILGAIHIAFWIWPFDWLVEGITFRKTLEIINGLLALLAIVYTGLLLGAIRPIPFWCSPLLPVLFLISGLTTALMATGLGAALWDLTVPDTERSSWAAIAASNTPLILMEGLVVFFYIQGSHLLEASRAAAHKMVHGDLASAFWIGFVFLGLVIPFAGGLIYWVLSPEYTGYSFILAVIVGVSGLVGGYLLRYLIVAGGIKTPFHVEGVVVPAPPET